MIDIFNKCKDINSILEAGHEAIARDEVIKLLDYMQSQKLEYSTIVNHLIRKVGLFPYINPETAMWQDRLVYELFKVDIGGTEQVTLHREQSRLLKLLLDGENIAVSAPTSFGKSFVIDAFISITQPSNVVIIVPTIALTDETRRRLYEKFSDEYKIITTTDVELSNKNIFIFPQERVSFYVNQLKNIDILIIDEFYKASSEFDKERSPALIKAIIQLNNKAKQKYYLAPNISSLSENVFTQNMKFVKLDFNTVFLERHNIYEDINKGLTTKEYKLLDVVDEKIKTLVYAGTFTEIEKITDLLLTSPIDNDSVLLADFSKWLISNYSDLWNLPKLVKKGIGLHNGRLHRSLCQIQIKLFENKDQLSTIISTSSIIEGVNTSAENVVVWKNKKGNANLDNFSHKNIIGRSGRMFKHFIGKVYLFETPPLSDDTQLNLEFPDNLLFDIEDNYIERDLTQDQIAKIMSNNEELSNILGYGTYQQLLKNNAFQSCNIERIIEIAKNIYSSPKSWKGLLYLNSNNVDKWSILYRILKLQPNVAGIDYKTFVQFVKELSNNWALTIPELLNRLCSYNVDVNTFFTLERNVTFKLSAILNDINIIQKAILKSEKIDISPFISKVSHAFLPPVVYLLEEYGLPRMISKKICMSGVIDLENPKLGIHEAIDIFNHIGENTLCDIILGLDSFERYILNYFYDGISSIKCA